MTDEEYRLRVREQIKEFTQNILDNPEAMKEYLSKINEDCKEYQRKYLEKHNP